MGVVPASVLRDALGASVVHYDATDLGSIIGWAARMEGKPLRDVMSQQQLDAWSPPRGKGAFGLAVERYFGIEQNSDHEPDFPEVGLELKVAPMRRDREGLTAKERVSITTINFAEAVSQAFERSPLDVKTRHILFVFYEWEKDQDPLDARVLKVADWRRDATVDAMARNCHNYVAERVVQGSAHLVTAKHTAVIEPATKGSRGQMWAGSESGSVPAKTRAYAFKRDYVHVLWRTVSQPETDRDEPSPEATFRERLRAQMLRFKGMTVAEINGALGLAVSMRPKHAHRLVADGMITWLREEEEDDDGGVPGGLQQLERMGITPRVVRLLEDGTPKEAPPMKSFTFDYLASTDFEDSFVAHSTQEVMFVVWSVASSIPESRLLDVAFWVPTDEDREAMRRDYDEARAAVLESDVEMLPTQTQAEILHVRTSGVDSSDRVPLPNGQLETRRGFYMNKKFAAAIIAQSRASKVTRPSSQD